MSVRSLAKRLQAPDFNLAYQNAQRAALVAANAAYTQQVVSPGNLAAPTNAVVAAVALTPKASGLYQFSAQLTLTAAGADTGLALVLESITGAGVTVIGGTNTNAKGGLVYETAGHLITFGATPVQTNIAGDSAPVSGGVITTRKVSGMVQLPLGAQSALALLRSSTGGINYTALALSASFVELP
jgi:hypothetical protein